MKIRPLGELVHVRMEPEKGASDGGIILPRPQPIRAATVLAVGPGRRDGKGRLTHTQVKPGDRVYLFAAAVDGHSQGQQIGAQLGPGEGLVPECDILFVAEDDVEVSL